MKPLVVAVVIVIVVIAAAYLDTYLDEKAHDCVVINEQGEVVE